LRVRISPSSKHQLHVYLFGAFRIEDKAQLIHLPTRKVESLLAYLILHPSPHPREKLAALFWGDSSDASARGSLRKALALLRKYINEGIVLSDRESVQLNSNFPLWVDVIEFQQRSENFLADPSQYSNPNQWDYYQDDLLHDNYDDWVLPLREQYRSLYLDVLLRAVERYRAESEYKLAIEYAQRILVIDPTNERAHQHLMFCYLTLGDRNKALQQYEACERVLLGELEVEPTRETQALYRWIKQAGSESPSLAARLTNLPIPISSFVGRHKELAKVKQLLSNARLVTLTGAGGSGKTRLAIHTATDLIDSFKDGIWWVELAPLTDPSLVPSAVAKALGLDGRSDQPLTETLKRFFRSRKVLLVLDNCEHLVDACAQLAESLLTSCAELKILATSRETLSLTGEHVWPVPVLSLPDVPNITLMDLLMPYEGIRLFTERATAINPDFVPNDENAVAIAKICLSLDGIPLAIELAAARIKTMSIQEISDGLADRFQLLSAQNRTSQTRHQTLRATVDWSYELLTEDERLLFCRLSIFSGGWTLDAVEAVCSGEGIDRNNISVLLARLVDKSLVFISDDGKRYGMLETIRQYAGEELTEAGSENWMVQQHLLYFLDLAEIADKKIRGPEQLPWIRSLEDERDNLMVAINRSLTMTSLVDMGCRLGSALCWYWYLTGDLIQIKHWLEGAFYQDAHLLKTTTRAKVLLNAGAYSALRVRWLEPVETCKVLEESRVIWNELGSEYALEAAQCLLYLGRTKKQHLSDDSGIEDVHGSIEIFKRLKNHWWQAWALNLLDILVGENRKFLYVREILEEETILWNEVGDRYGKAICLMGIGHLELNLGNFSDSAKFLEESIKILTEFNAKSSLQLLMWYIGDAALGLRQYDQAKLYLEESEQLTHMIGRSYYYPPVYHSLGYATLHMGDDQKAEECFNQALRIDRKYNYILNLVYGLMNFAFLAAFRRNPVIAARLFGAFHANIEVLHKERKLDYSLIDPLTQQEIDHYLSLCQTQIDESEFEQAWNEGSSLTLNDALGEIINVSG